MSRALWCVVNGRAWAPPGIGWKIGVSTSMNPRSSSQRRVRLTIRLRAMSVVRLSGLAQRST